ncbi:MAG: tetratricopeptide repeat protein, partial [Chthoniobacterales bacterium]
AAQPDHPMAGAAWLALGEIRQSQGKKPDALEAYRVASGRYQSSYAAPLALLAEARLLASEGKGGESKAILESIGSSYPDGPAAMVAAAELAAISRSATPAAQGQ